MPEHLYFVITHLKLKELEQCLWLYKEFEKKMVAKLYVKPSNCDFNKPLCVHVNFLLHKLSFLAGLLLHKLIAPL